MRFFIALVAFGLLIQSVTAQAVTAQHDHHAGGTPRMAPPKVFLDKSPRVVAYQLQRLDNPRLLMVERNTEDQKYIPVYEAILARAGMSAQDRQQALAALVELKQTDAAPILLDVITRLDSTDPAQQQTARQLATLLLSRDVESLQLQTAALRDALAGATAAGNRLAQAIAAAALIAAGHSEAVITDASARIALLDAVEFLPDPQRRVDVRETVVQLLTNADSVEQRNAAINALGFIATEQQETFALVAPLATQAEHRETAIRMLLKIPPQQRPAEAVKPLLAHLVDFAEQTSPDQRTNDAFIDAMQLADQSLAHVPPDIAKQYRSRLDAVTVRVVRIKTVAEEMRYDTPYFAVAAGKSVQIVLDNEDMMPHNLVITTPGSLRQVAELGLDAGPQGAAGGFPYVPPSDLVLQATDMVPAHGQQRLTFTAPQQPGEYPYVCTFPQHWYRMHGVMVVVDDLDDWLKNPVPPASPIGSNREFVRSWSVEDFQAELEAGLQGRSAEIGKRLFVEASCAGCHKLRGDGGIIGPDLTDLWKRWQGDATGVLREILDPSHKIDAKYAMQQVLTSDGQVITGVLASEDDSQVTLLVSPDAKQPTVIAREDIEQMSPSSTSIMPKALLDQYTKDEIFELLAYLQGE
jgi:putative heme-binding domain-containing protein